MSHISFQAGGWRRETQAVAAADHCRADAGRHQLDALGKAVSIDANKDSQAVADLLRRQAASGIAEALAPPIEM